MSNSKLLTPNLDSYATNSIAKSVSMSRGFHTGSGATSLWKTLSTTAASGAVPRPRTNHSEDAMLSLVLLCSLASSEVPLDLISRGASPRRRWNAHGGIEEKDALYIALSSALVDLLSSIAKLDNALCELVSLSAISKSSDETYMVNRAVQARVSDSLPPELHSFWRLQALVVAYRSIPWKYLELGPFGVRELFIPHLRHTLQGVRNHDHLIAQATAMTLCGFIIILILLEP